MASCITPQWANAAPQAKLEVTQTASTATTSTLTWKLSYIATSAASASADRDYTVTINGKVVKTGSYNINNKKGTYQIATGTVTINKTTSAQSIPFKVEFEFKLTWGGTYGGFKSASSSISVAAKTKYTVEYDANGGSGAPSSQTKWHGTNLTLSTSKPKRSGYGFSKWNTNSSGTGTSYNAGGTYSANANVTLYAVWSKNTYTITYNANGGSGAPGNQTKTHGVNLTISTTEPKKTGYDFKGWSLTQGGSVYYTSGSTCGKNEDLTLYAVWEAKSYTVKYDANGGSGAPSNQTKKYGTNLTLSTVKPTKSGYTFLRWNTNSAGTGTSYNAGGTYSANAAVTLYAVWSQNYNKPRITDYELYRCNSSGTEDENGSYARVKFHWECDNNNLISDFKIDIGWKRTTESSYETYIQPSLSGTSGDCDQIFGDGNFSTDYTYDVFINVFDGIGSTMITLLLSGTKYVIDVLTQGNGLAFGKPAEKENTIEFGMRMWSKYGDIMPTPVSLVTNEDLNDVRDFGYYILPTTTISPTIKNKPELSTTGTGILEVIPGGNGIQVIQRLTQCDKDDQYIWQRCYYTNAWGSWQMLCGGTKNYTFTKSANTTINRYTLSRSGDIVTMYINCKWSSAINAGSSVTIGTIPSYIRPLNSVATAGIVGTTGTCTGWVQNTGNVLFRPTSAYTAGTAIEFNLTWNVTATFKDNNGTTITTS